MEYRSLNVLTLLLYDPIECTEMFLSYSILIIGLKPYRYLTWSGIISGKLLGYRNGWHHIKYWKRYHYHYRYLYHYHYCYRINLTDYGMTRYTREATCIVNLIYNCIFFN